MLWLIVFFFFNLKPQLLLHRQQQSETHSLFNAGAQIKGPVFCTIHFTDFLFSNNMSPACQRTEHWKSTISLVSLAPCFRKCLLIPDLYRPVHQPFVMSQGILIPLWSDFWLTQQKKRKQTAWMTFTKPVFAKKRIFFLIIFFFKVKSKLLMFFFLQCQWSLQNNMMQEQLLKSNVEMKVNDTTGQQSLAREPARVRLLFLADTFHNASQKLATGGPQVPARIIFDWSLLKKGVTNNNNSPPCQKKGIESEVVFENDLGLLCYNVTENTNYNSKLIVRFYSTDGDLHSPQSWWFVKHLSDMWHKNSEKQQF